jgi:hypothetical protein
MNVLMVTSSYPKFRGDVTAPFIESIALGVAARGHQVDVVLPHHPDLARGAEEPYASSLPLCARRLERLGYARAWRATRAPVYLQLPGGSRWPPRWARVFSSCYDVVHALGGLRNAALVQDIVRAHGVLA